MAADRVPEQTAQQGPMYDWVARHVSEVEHEVIEFRGSTLDLLKAARTQDARMTELEQQRDELVRAGELLAEIVSDLLPSDPKLVLDDDAEIVGIPFGEIKAADEAWGAVLSRVKGGQ